MALKAEKFLGPDYLETEIEQAFQEIEVDQMQLLDIELERERFLNVREQTAMLLHIITPDTDIWYPPITRTKFEVRNGIKIAVSRGANLYETEVFNLLFNFSGHLKGDGIALMCHGPQGQEWIMLCPDDTMARIQMEKDRCLGFARILQTKGRISNDEENKLIENVGHLNLGSRCANSLMHEYGHVLQHRIWAAKGIPPHDEEQLYQWFHSIGYATLVSMRAPGFLENPLYYLKESFVEDYRIGLNLLAEKGIFELPNAYCFRGDIAQPELMNEGVRIVKETISKHKGEPSVFREGAAVEREPDRIKLIDHFMKIGMDFDPEKARLTPEDHQKILERLRAKKLQRAEETN
jgi:hypothetical protein